MKEETEYNLVGKILKPKTQAEMYTFAMLSNIDWIYISIENDYKTGLDV